MTKFKKLSIAKRLFAMALAATMAFSFSTVQLFAADEQPEETQTGTATTTTESTTAATTEATSTTTTTTEATSATTTTTEATTATTPAAEPKPVGTLITLDSYEYKVTSANTVSLMGFAGNAEETYVKVKNSITYDGVTYNVTQIDTKAFMKESSITKVLIRKNVTDIGRRAFFQCTNLKTVNIKIGAKVIRKCAFKGCKALRVVNIKSGVLEDVKANAFKNTNTNLVINVATKNIKKMMKATVPSYVIVNRAFDAPSTSTSTTN